MKFYCVILVALYALVATAAPVVDVREASVEDRAFDTVDFRRDAPAEARAFDNVDYRRSEQSEARAFINTSWKKRAERRQTGPFSSPEW